MRRLQMLKEYVRFRYYARHRPGRFPHVNLSFSQFGEDMVLAALLRDDDRRFYVDIGAHHPVMISNTYHFYLRGWRGINVDAEPGSMELFRWIRPRDCNVEAAISDVTGKTLQFYRFKAAALNTTDTARAAQLKSAGEQVQEIVQVRTLSAMDLMNKYVPRGQKISLLTIDTELNDINIIRSIDWHCIRPRIVAFELLDVPWHEVQCSEAVQLLVKNDYRLCAKAGPTIIMESTCV